MVTTKPDTVVPAGGDCTTLKELQLSELVTGLKAGKSTVQEAFTVSVWVPGQVKLGGVPSILFTLKKQVAVLPFASVARSETVVNPMPDTEVPAAGVWSMAGAPQLSELLKGL